MWRKTIASVISDSAHQARVASTPLGARGDFQAVHIEAEERVLALAFEKVNGERNTLRDLRAGHRITDVFARYGIL